MMDAAVLDIQTPDWGGDIGDRFDKLGWMAGVREMNGVGGALLLY